MFNLRLYWRTLLTISSIVLLFGCDQELEPLRALPVIEILDFTDVNQSGITLNAEIIRTGSNPLDERYGFAISYYSFEFDDDLSRIEYVDVPEGMKSYSYRLDSALIEGLRYEIRAFAESNNERTVTAAKLYRPTSTSQNIGWSKALVDYPLYNDRRMTWIGTKENVFLVDFPNRFLRYSLDDLKIEALPVSIPRGVRDFTDFFPLTGQQDRVIAFQSEDNYFTELKGTTWESLDTMPSAAAFEGRYYSTVVQKEDQWYAFSFAENYFTSYNPILRTWREGAEFEVNGTPIGNLFASNYDPGTGLIYAITYSNRLYAFDELSSEFTEVADLPGGNSQFNGVKIETHSDKFIIGPISEAGFADGRARKWFFISYDPVSNTWTEFGDFTSTNAVQNTQMIVRNGILFFGLIKSNEVLDIFQYALP